MPTQLDRALQSKTAFFGFAGIVTAAAAWMIWGSDMFPAEPDPTGDPETWSQQDLTRWLNNRNLFASQTMSRDELLQRVKDHTRRPR